MLVSFKTVKPGLTAVKPPLVNNISFGGSVSQDSFDKKYPYLAMGNPDNFPKERVVAVYCSSSKSGYDIAYQLGKRIAESKKLGGVLTGGTVGLMEAVNKGCKDASGYSIGVSEKSLEKYQPPNNYLDELHSTPNDYDRENWYNNRAAYTIVMPGGPGTLRETFNKIVFLLKDKFFKQPEEREFKFQHQVILLETPDTKGFWSELYKWMCEFPRYASFYDNYLAHIKVVRSIDEAMTELEKGLDYDPLEDPTRYNKALNAIVESN